ncbi:MAG: tetratricopeptide repeat protein [Acidobacteria bacterium]|nr:tetratricopeptide repeat protein [Acidobacteriota bacterium]
MTRYLSSALVVILMFVGVAGAQEWRGQGRVAGKVVDEAGAPIEGVRVVATLATSENRGPNPQTTNARGDWSIGGISGGRWLVEFTKEGYITHQQPVVVSESVRMAPATIVLEKAEVVVDPNDIIRERLIVAAELMTSRKFAEARAIYEDLSREFPNVIQFKPLLARAHHAEGNTTKAIELLKDAVAADSSQIEVQVLLGTLLIGADRMAEGQAVLASIDASKIGDPTVFVNIGINLINDKQPAEAIVWLTKGVTTFPKDPTAYYYRGVTHLSMGNTAGAKTDLEMFVKLAPATAPELAAAKQILETIKGE